MKYWILTILVAINVVLIGNNMVKKEEVPLPILSGVTTVKHVGPDYLYPDPKLTPGKADTLSFADLTKSYNGQTYSQSHRAVSSSEKKTICAEYPVQCKNSVEIDHFYPLCGGGANDKENLWAQQEVNEWNGEDWGFHKKDVLEVKICVMIKKGLLDPKVAFQKMTTDWISFYKEII